uniref:Beta-catenin-like protein 1 n=1 Tax=Fundulus heteroclitus TaxID=8078 RepID=A0A3Q2QIP9_FUNHE
GVSLNLLLLQPDRGAKRPRGDDGGAAGGDDTSRGGKQQKGVGAREAARYREMGGGTEGGVDMKETEELTGDKKMILEKLMDQDEEEPEAEPVDESSVKKMILTFEKRSYKNQELRIKFPDNPEKFMESELDLNDIIQEMHVIATMPDLYHLLVELNAVHSLLGLLSHENTDILSTVVDLLQELTDIDTLHESEEGAEVLIDALLEGQVVALLVQNMERLDEQVKEEADGIYNTLAIVENMAEFRPGLCTEAAQQGLMQWLLKRIKAKMPFDANKLYCSEILAILLQNNDTTRELLGEMDGIDVLLQQLSVFKRHNPNTAEEQEMMENLFDALCSCLMLASNRDRFLKGEGLQLMNLMLSTFMLPHVHNRPAVYVLLLTWFLLLGFSFQNCSKGNFTFYSSSEHVCSVIASMLRNLKSQQRTRLLNKFTENDCEKVKFTLSELYAFFLGEMVRRGEILDDGMEDEFYLRRLDAGLFVLQLLCYIMVEISSSGVSQLQQRVHQILNIRGGSVKVVRHIMREYAESIGDGKSDEFKEAERKRIMDLADNF